MMIKKIDHISFAVRDLEDAGERMVKLFGAEFLMHVVNEEMKYTCDAYTLPDGLIIGLLGANSEDSFVAEHLNKYGESLQHIGVDVGSLDQVIENLKANGVPYSGYKNMNGVKSEILLGSRYTFGSILQIQEWQGDFKEYSSRERMLKAWGL